MDPAQLAAALQAEYLHLQKTIEDFDSKALTIKAWSVTFSLTVLVGAFASNAAPVLLIACAASLLFWFLETMWKWFQLGYYERVQALEAHFAGERELSAPNQIYGHWMRMWNRTPWSAVFKMMFWPHIALPHAVVAAAGLAMFTLIRSGWLAL